MVGMKRIVCLANSYKTEGRCIAGKDVLGGRWIRPISDRPGEELFSFEYCDEHGASPDLLDLIDLPLLKAVPDGHQTENHLIGAARWAKKGALCWDDLAALEDRPESLWANTESTKGGGLNDCMSAQIAAAYRHSLALLKLKQLVIEIGINRWRGESKTCRGKFVYAGVEHSLRVTDPATRTAFQNSEVGAYPLDDVYLCVSLTKPYEKDGRCHKIIASVMPKRPIRKS